MDYNEDGTYETSFHFGIAGDIPIAGDWNADGITDVGVFRPFNGNWYLDYNKDSFVDKTFHFGSSSDIPKVGKWV